MRADDAGDLRPYLDLLDGLPFVTGVAVVLPGQAGGGVRPDTILRLTTPRGKRELRAEIKRTHLTNATVGGTIARIPERQRTQWLLLAPFIGAGIGQQLKANGINYMDEAGNCYIALAKEYVAFVEGRRAQRRPVHERGIRAAGYQVLFALLARRDLMNAPVRGLAEAAAVGKSAAAEMLKRLQNEGLAGTDRDGRRLLMPEVVLDRWIAGYVAQVRPRLMIGRFRTREQEPGAMENWIEQKLGETTAWAWGGGAAAIRLTGYYRGTETVLHLADRPRDIGRRLQAVPDRLGPLVVLGVPGPIAFEGALERTVHPLLVYTELLATGGERAREAAQELWTRYREWTG
jgi:hypothetical protein